jgi:hypothetical protein
MAQKIFISHNFNDRNVCATVQDMMQKKKQDIMGQLVFVDNDVSYNGQTAINWEVSNVMKDCDAALFVLADNPRNSPWLEQEVTFAIAAGMSIMVVQLPQTDHITFPQALANINCVKLGWHEKEIVACLNNA